MGRRAAEVTLSEDQHRALVALSRRRTTAQALAKPARIVLGCAQGTQNKQVAADLGLDPATMGKWRRRFIAEITERQIKRGVHRSAKELERAILAYIDIRNEESKPFISVRTADQILDAVKRFCLRNCPEDSNAYL